MKKNKTEISTVQNKYGACFLPEEFVQSAEETFNSHDADMASMYYENDAILELITDGFLDTVEGKEKIRFAWRSIFESIPDFKLVKNLVAYTEMKIINEWKGTIERNQEIQSAWGIEIWEFNTEGEISHHRLYTFLKIRNANRFWSKIIFLIRHPLIGLKLNNKRKKILKEN